MKTTRKIANQMWRVALAVDYYGVWATGKNEAIKDLLSKPLEQNLKEQNEWISEQYSNNGEDISDLLDDYELVIELGKLYKLVRAEQYKDLQNEIENTKGEKKND